MKEKYDFGVVKVEKPKLNNLQENTELEEQYDFIEESNTWASAAKAAMSIANNSYSSNMAKGAALGSTVGAVGGVLKNATKRDDDPTKKGILGAAVSGATKGAVAGGTMGAGARWLVRRDLGKMGIQAMSDKALQRATTGLTIPQAQTAAEKTIKFMNSGSKGNSATHAYMGIGKDGVLRRGVSDGNTMQKLGYKLGFGSSNDNIKYIGDAYV